jgi:phosphatidylserine/phosphatidylglycerophosphate/cardiolipin synthase-like enzyme
MNPADVERFLRQSLADRKLSGAEKQALADWLAGNARTDQQKGVVRHTAFDVARGAVSDPDAARVIAWLEDVLKVVCPVAPPAPAAGSPQPAHAYFAPGGDCLAQIVHCFGQARRTADVCVFTITDDRIARAVLDAHRRGVVVRVISDNEKCHDAGSDVFRLRDAGIAVKLDDARGPADHGLTGHMHHKFAVFDGVRLLNGSYNWTRGAADVNYENLTDTTDPRLVAAFAAEFERLWNTF